MSAFTPGPWTLRRAAMPDNTGGYDWAIIAPGKAIIAECFEHVDWREPGVTYDVRPAEAHARLFRAAPDLLAALHGLLDGFPLPATANEYELVQAGCDPTEARKIAAARAAILKAEGDGEAGGTTRG